MVEVAAHLVLVTTASGCPAAAAAVAVALHRARAARGTGRRCCAVPVASTTSASSRSSGLQTWRRQAAARWQAETYLLGFSVPKARRENHARAWSSLRRPPSGRSPSGQTSRLFAGLVVGGPPWRTMADLPRHRRAHGARTIAHGARTNAHDCARWRTVHARLRTVHARLRTVQRTICFCWPRRRAHGASRVCPDLHLGISGRAVPSAPRTQKAFGPLGSGRPQWSSTAN